MNDLDKLFTELRASEPYLDDDDFTAGVMTRLPAQQAALPWWLKNLILMSATVAGAALATWALPVQQLLGDIFSLGLNLNLESLGAAALVTYLLSGVALWLARRLVF